MNPIKQYIEELCEATLYHGSPFPDIVECEDGICLAYNEDIAKEYAGDLHDDSRKRNHSFDYDHVDRVFGGKRPDRFVYVVEVSDSINIASSQHLKSAYSVWRSMSNDNMAETDEYAMADIEGIRDLLRSKGFDAIEYDDFTPEESWEHKTLRILNPAVVKIIGRKQVK